MTGVMLAVAMMLPGQVAGKENSKAPAPAMVPLFDGKTLDGWVEPMDNGADWSVSGDILEGRGGGDRRPGVLVTQRTDYSNYRLRVVFGFQTPGGGGIELRRSGDGDVTNCYWVSACVSPYNETKERPPGNITKLKDYRYGSLFPPARTSATVNAGVNRWHTMEVTVNGDRVTTVMNGRQVDSYADRKLSNRSGAIALVCRGTSVIQFKSVQIEELPE